MNTRFEAFVASLFAVALTLVVTAGVADRMIGSVAGFAVGSRSDMADTPAVAATITAAATSRATRAPDRIFNLISRWVAHRARAGTAGVAASGTFVLACGHFAAGLRWQSQVGCQPVCSDA